MGKGLKDRALELDGSWNEVGSKAPRGPSLPSTHYSDFGFPGECILYPLARQFPRTVINQRWRQFAVRDQKSEFPEVSREMLRGSKCQLCKPEGPSSCTSEPT